MMDNDHAEPHIIQLIRSDTLSDQNDAIRSLITLFLPKINTFVINNNGNKADGDDLFQDALTVLYQKVRDDDQLKITNLESYFFGICKFLWFKKIREDKRLPFVDLEHYSIKGEVKTDIQSEQIEMIMDVMDQISEACRKLLSLFYFDKLSMEEISERLGYSSAQVVKSKKYKCLNSLKEKVKSKWDSTN